MTATPCEACHGFRLKPEALRSRSTASTSASEPCSRSARAVEWAKGPAGELDAKRNEIAQRILKEIARPAHLPARRGVSIICARGSSVRCRAGKPADRASQIGSGLTGVLYVLDEPSIAAHQRDNARLLDTRRRLRGLAIR